MSFSWGRFMCGRLLFPDRLSLCNKHNGCTSSRLAQSKFNGTGRCTLQTYWKHHLPYIDCERTQLHRLVISGWPEYKEAHVPQFGTIVRAFRLLHGQDFLFEPRGSWEEGRRHVGCDSPISVQSPRVLAFPSVRTVLERFDCHNPSALDQRWRKAEYMGSLADRTTRLQNLTRSPQKGVGIAFGSAHK